MRIPPELEHLIKASVSVSGLESAGKITNSVTNYLDAIDTRKALEVEHYLRSCILRLEITDGLG